MNIGTLDRFLKGVSIAILAGLRLLVASAAVFLECFLTAVRYLVKTTETTPD